MGVSGLLFDKIGGRFPHILQVDHCCLAHIMCRPLLIYRLNCEYLLLIMLKG